MTFSCEVITWISFFIDRLMALKYLTLTNKIFSDTRGYIVDMYLKKVEESLKEESEEE